MSALQRMEGASFFFFLHDTNVHQTHFDHFLHHFIMNSNGEQSQQHTQNVPPEIKVLAVIYYLVLSGILTPSANHAATLLMQ